MTSIVEINALTKVYGRGKKAFKAVDRLSFSVEAGKVYGFLGPNGAGKTTTIRMLLGLHQPTSGDVRLFGESTQSKNIHNIRRKRIGALVEGATLYPYMTGRETLEIYARTSGSYHAQKIDDLLDLVGMSDRADRQSKGYSTGMKQRIGIASTLLNDPDLVILDEPTNGLDPRGIQDIRQLIRQLVDEMGKTVLLSSHMLHEVEQVCDHVAIINNGKLIQQGAVAELLADQQTIMIEAEPLADAYALLTKKYPTEQLNTSINIHATRDQLPNIIADCVHAGIRIYNAQVQRRTLEDYFLDLTQESTS